MPISVELIANLPLLQGLDSDTLQKVAGLMISRTYLPHDKVMRKGNAVEHLAFLLSGKLQVVDLSEDGRETGIGIIQPGAHFGELSVIDSLPCSASVLAMVLSNVAFLPQNQARALIYSRPIVAERMFIQLAHALRASSNQRTLLSIPNAFQRVFAQLHLFVRETPTGKVIELPKQHEVAIMVNTSRETVSRALHLLIKMNVLEKKGAMLLVHHPDQLKNAAEVGLEDVPVRNPDKTGT